MVVVRSLKWPSAKPMSLGCVAKSMPMMVVFKLMLHVLQHPAALPI